MKLQEKMNEYVYCQGYTIRERDSNNFGEHKILKINSDGTYKFLKYAFRSKVPWGRFLTRRDANYFMIKHNLSFLDYEVVKAKHPKYLKLVDENYSLYKVISDSYELITLPKESVKFINDSGTQQDYPSIPPTVKASNKSIAYFLFKDMVKNYWIADIKNLRYKDVEGDNCRLSMEYLLPQIKNGSFNVWFKYTLRGKDYDLDSKGVLDLLSDLSDDLNTDIKSTYTESTSKAYEYTDYAVWCETNLSFNFTGLFREAIPESKLPQGVKLTKMSDKDLYEIKKYIEENEKSIFDNFILKPLNEEYNILVDNFKKIDLNVQKYFDTEVIESLDRLSLKELFTKAYEDE